MASRRRRTLGRALQGAGQTLQFMIQQRNLDRRQASANDATLTGQMLDDVRAKLGALGDPKTVADLGPERASQAYDTLVGGVDPIMRKRLPARPNFTALDTTPEQRAGQLVGEITSSDKRAPTGMGLSLIASGRRLPTQNTGSMPNALMEGNAGPMGGESPVFNDDLLSQIEQIAQGHNARLDASLPRTKVSDFSGGTQRDAFLTNPELAGRSFQGERSAEQEAGRQATITGATTQAQEDVLHKPVNIAGNASRFFAQQFAGQQAQTDPRIVARRVDEAGRTSGAQHEAVAGVDQARGIGLYEPKPIETQGDDGRKSTTFVTPQAGTTVDQGFAQPTEGQAKSYGHAKLMADANDVMHQLEPRIAQAAQGRNLALELWMLNRPDAIQDPTMRAYSQAARVFINSELRRQSGAAISDEEFKRFGPMVQFTVGTDPTTLALRQRDRRTMVENAVTESGPRFKSEFVTPEWLQQNGYTPDEAYAEGLRILW